MNIKKGNILRIPLFCIIGGILAFNLSLHLFSRLAIVRQQDGMVTIDNTRVLMIQGMLFAIAFLIGGLVFFRKMTRKEIFLSASIVVLYGLILIFIQWAFNLTTGPIAVLMIYLFLPFEWCAVASQIFLNLGGNIWLGVIFQIMAPYLFVLFGKQDGGTRRDLPPMFR